MCVCVARLMHGWMSRKDTNISILLFADIKGIFENRRVEYSDR